MTTTKDQAKDELRRRKKNKTIDSQTTSDGNLRLAIVLVSLSVSVRSARAALRVSITHWAAHIIMDDPGETAFNPAERHNDKITTNYFQQETEKKKTKTNTQQRNHQKTRMNATIPVSQSLYTTEGSNPTA